MSLTTASRQLGQATLGLLQGHLELFSLELSQQRNRAIRGLLLLGACLCCALLLLVGLSALLLIIYWDSHRLEAAVGLCLFYATGVIASAAGLAHNLFRQPKAFSATLAELERDREQLLP